MAHPTRTRRQFLAHTASGFGATWIAAQWPAIAAVHMHAAAATTNPRSLTFGFLTQDEARDVEALAAQIVPSDDTPGAREAGALHFIDRSLHTWAASIADPFRVGLRDFQAAFATGHPHLTFAAADSQTQVAYLTQVDGTEFFRTIRFLTLLGMFALPSYGGNRDGIGWTLLGFDDTHAYAPPFGYYDRDYAGFIVAEDGV